MGTETEDNLQEMTTIIKTDGKREIKISRSEYGVDLSFCSNGWQHTIVTIDEEMLSWVAVATQQYIDQAPSC